MKELPYVIFIIIQTYLIYFTFKTAKVKYKLLELDSISCTKHFYQYGYKLTIASRCFIGVAYVIFIIFFVFVEGEISNDYPVYKGRFESANQSLITSLTIQDNEWGYGLLIWLIRSFTNDFKIVLFVITTIIFISTVHFLKNIHWDRYTIASYLLLLLLLVQSLCLFRNVLSVALSMYVFQYLFEKKYAKGFIVACLIFTIHISAVILLPIILITKIIGNRSIVLSKCIILVLVGSVALYIVMGVANNLLSITKYTIYLEGTALAISTYLMFCILIILFSFRYKNLIKANPYNKSCFIIILTIPFVFVAQLRYPILYRMILFYQPITFYVVAELMREYKFFKRKNIIYLFVNIGLMLYILISVYRFFTESLESLGMYPYANILF